jgi:hypothetical protein
MAGYTRQSVADIINGLEVTAPPLNAEFNQVAAAFDASSGHLHDGSTGNAPKINLSTSVDGYLPADNGGVGGRNKTDATSNPTVTNDVGEGYAPGSLWLNTSTGRVFTCVGNAAGAAVWREAAQITENGVFFPETNDTVDLGKTTKRFKNLYLSGVADIQGSATVGGNLSVTGTATLSSATVSSVASLPTVNIDGGNIDGTVIGNSAPAAITGTVVTANTGFTGDLTGNVTGNLTGNVAGGVTGNLIGDVTGDVASSGTSTFQNVTINGSLDMNAGTTATVTGLSTPVNAADAATKGYVDQEVSAVIDAAPGALDTLNELSAALNDDADFATTVNNSIANRVSTAGDTMTGQLDMGANKIVNVATPTAGSDASTKAYVDGVAATNLDLSGGTMTGNIVMGANKVTSTSNPTADDDLTRKGYVDSTLGSATEVAANTALTQTLANNAATSEANAAISASNAATSEANAATSETNAASSEANAAASEAGASTSETNAATSEANAATSETNAAASEANAATSETNAAASEANASTSETNAAASEANAATSEANAAASEANASTSETNAAASASAAAASFDDFDDRYLGAKASAPATDNDGDPLVEGTFYWNTTSKNLFVYNGSAWVAAVFDTAGAMFGVNNLSDVDDAATSRANLGLGTAATQPATAFATSAQGSLADTAVQPGDLGTAASENATAFATPSQSVAFAIIFGS